MYLITLLDPRVIRKYILLLYPSLKTLGSCRNLMIELQCAMGEYEASNLLVLKDPLSLELDQIG